MLKEKGDAVRDNAQFFIRATLGDFDEAFEALMHQAELHSWYYLVKCKPFLEDLHDPRFSEFCKKVGLPP